MSRAGDDGAPDPRLSAALRAWAHDPADRTRAQVLAALSGARVFLALAARATGEQASPVAGLRQESGAEMALLSVAGADGARALPAFTDGHAVQRWRPEARPVPVPGPVACGTAVQDGAAALLLDPHGPAFVVDAGELGTLAAGRVPVPGTALSTRRATAALTRPAAPPADALLAALGAALHGEPVRAAELLDGPDGPVLGIVPQGRSDPAALAALAARVAARLGPALPAGGLDLTVVLAPGTGSAVPLPRRRWRRR